MQNANEFDFEVLTRAYAEVVLKRHGRPPATFLLMARQDYLHAARVSGMLTGTRAGRYGHPVLRQTVGDPR